MIIFTIAMALLPGEAPYASTITKTFDFHASGFFTPLGEAAPPQDPVFGSFTITYDATTDIIGGALDNIDLTIGGFSYNIDNTAFNYNSTYDRFLVGGLLNGIDRTYGATDDFFMSFIASTSSPIFYASFAYITSTTPEGTPIFLADTRSPPSNVTITERVVPIPSSIVLLALGLTGVALGRRRRRNGAGPPV